MSKHKFSLSVQPTFARQGCGRYPLQEKHTYNQPFINIISIADSINAATDNIGRPYGTGKTLTHPPSATKAH